MCIRDSYGEDKTEVYWIHFTGSNVKNILRQYGFPDKERVFQVGTSNAVSYTHLNSGFSWQPAHLLRYFSSLRFTSSDCRADLPARLLPRLHRFSLSRLRLSFCVPTVLSYDSTGISTCCPSATSFDLALGPDLPRADELYSGNLRYSAGRILTFLSLLITAFSLLSTPLLLIGTASLR